VSAEAEVAYFALQRKEIRRKTHSDSNDVYTRILSSDE